MSQVRADVDLAQLARPGEPGQPGQPGQSVRPPRRRWRRYALPALILAAFAAVLATTLPELLRPTVEVSVVRPRRAAEAETSAGTRAVVLQAAGWVEPDPFPIHVAALTAGVVEALLVQESDPVAAGDPVATLIDDDARIARDAAGAELAAARAEESAAEARARIAGERFEAALEVTEAEAAALADLESWKAAAALRRAAVAQGEARVALAEDELVVQRELEAAGASGPLQVELAEAALEEARALLAGLSAEAERAAAEARRAAAVHGRAAAERELRFDDRLELELARSGLARARAQVRRAEAALEEAELRLERTTIRSPADGVVLERLTFPGMVLSVETVGHAVCSLYDPSSLRVRVDVPQAELGRLSVGQRVELDASSRPGRPYSGEVIRIVQQADIQKVTLQAHVRLADGDVLLRPEMLVQARFFGTGDPDATADAAGSGEVLIPARLVRDGAVWVVDGARAEAALRPVELGGRRGEWVVVTRGLNLTDKLIDEGRAELEVGDRVRARDRD